MQVRCVTRSITACLSSTRHTIRASLALWLPRLAPHSVPRPGHFQSVEPDDRRLHNRQPTTALTFAVLATSALAHFHPNSQYFQVCLGNWAQQCFPEIHCDQTLSRLLAIGGINCPSSNDRQSTVNTRCIIYRFIHSSTNDELSFV